MSEFHRKPQIQNFLWLDGEVPYIIWALGGDKEWLYFILHHLQTQNQEQTAQLLRQRHRQLLFAGSHECRCQNAH